MRRRELLVNTNSHEDIDLGLPSGLKWATCNIGAKSVYETGDLFSWGGMIPDDTTDYYRSALDGQVLPLSNDTAHVKWGGDWRMPTREELKELLDNTTVNSFETSGGYTFLRLRSKSDSSKFLIIPKTSYVSWNGNQVEMWTSTAYTDSGAYYLYSREKSSFNCYVATQPARFHAYAVRPVHA